jgi:mRNA-degrading endonuclease toxin of MazEF toxin-antitoxin module
VRVRLDPTIGAEQAGERPALVISPELINQHSPVVLVAAVTSRKGPRRNNFTFWFAEGMGQNAVCWSSVWDNTGSVQSG